VASARWLDTPPSGWEDLLRDDPNATPAHRPTLAWTLAATLGGMTPVWIAVEEGGALTGGAPVMMERRAGLQRLFAMPFMLPGAPLARAGTHARVDEAVAGAIAERSSGLFGGEWVLYRPEGPEPEPVAVERVPGETRRTESAIVDLREGVEPAWKQLNPYARHGIRAARRRGLVFAEEPGAVEEAYVLYVAQAKEWSRHRPRPLEMWRRLVSTGDGGGPAARLFTVRIGSDLLAALLALVHARETLAWMSGAHPEARQRNAFSVLEWGLAEWAAAAGCDRLNLGASEGLDPVMTFKRRMGARFHDYPVRRFGWGEPAMRALRAWWGPRLARGGERAA